MRNCHEYKKKVCQHLTNFICILFDSINNYKLQRKPYVQDLLDL